MKTSSLEGTPPGARSTPRARVARACSFAPEEGPKIRPCGNQDDSPPRRARRRVRRPLIRPLARDARAGAACSAQKPEVGSAAPSRCRGRNVREPRRTPKTWTRRVVLAVMLLAVIALVGGLPGRARADTTTLKIGTLLPQNSPWGHELKKWADLVASDTGGDLQIDFQWTGQAGDEVLMVQKIRTGQLDAAVVSAAGLAQTGVTDAFDFPASGTLHGLEQARLGAGRGLGRPQQAVRGSGLRGAGLGRRGCREADVGGLRGASSNRPARQGGLHRARRPNSPLLFSAIGGIAPRTLPVTEILPGLSNGSVTFLSTSAILAEQLQWASRITHVEAKTRSRSPSAGFSLRRHG